MADYSADDYDDEDRAIGCVILFVLILAIAALVVWLR